MHITFQSFRLTLEARDTIILPVYKGSTFRGGFGNVFKKIVCALRRQDCSACLLKEKCLYSYVFETPPPSDSAIMTKYKAAPHPFIIEPPEETTQMYHPEDELEFGLTLIGRAVDYLPYFIYTFDKLGNTGIGRSRGKYILKKVTYQNGPDGKPDAIIYSPDAKTIKPFETSTISCIMSDESSNQGRVILRFNTPTRIIFGEHLILDLEFHILVRQLLRRLSLLSYFHCGHDFSHIDFRKIIARSEEVEVVSRSLKWHDWERYSARQDTRMKMGGFVGEITFEGDTKQFLPIIRAGQILHVGKGTSFGLGRYTMLAPASLTL